MTYFPYLSPYSLLCVLDLYAVRILPLSQPYSVSVRELTKLPPKPSGLLVPRDAEVQEQLVTISVFRHYQHTDMTQDMEMLLSERMHELLFQSLTQVIYAGRTASCGFVPNFEIAFTDLWNKNSSIYEIATIT